MVFQSQKKLESSYKIKPSHKLSDTFISMYKMSIILKPTHNLSKNHKIYWNLVCGVPFVTTGVEIAFNQ